MRVTIALVASTIASFTLAAENPVAKLGLADGSYCSAKGESVTVMSQSSPPYMGIDYLDCHDPVVANGRLTAKTCYANGGIKLSVAKRFASLGDTLTIDGVAYKLMPSQPGRLACEAQQASKTASTTAPAVSPDPGHPVPGLADTTGPGWSTWSHNNSTMLINERTGQIVYEQPKASLSGTVERGTVLFQGHFEGKNVAGFAYVFKKGCMPAPYAVSGRVESNPRGFGSRIVLSGAGPRRNKNSCMVLGTGVAHSKLVFEEAGDI